VKLAPTGLTLRQTRQAARRDRDNGSLAFSM
jgi:hypothetical protein